MSYDTREIRDFLQHRFSDSELMQFCFDYFLDVYHNFSASWSKADKIQHLLAHCLQNQRFPDLLAALERERPQAYAAAFPTRPTITPLPPTSRESPKRQPEQVFISHAHQDSDIAHRLAHDLRVRGLSVWIAPDSIRPGEKWVEAINRGLAESGVFLLVLTPTAVASPWVQDETNVAIELSKEEKLQFIPLEIESCEIPPLWRVYQRINFHADYEAGLAILLQQLGVERVHRRQEPERRPFWTALPRWGWGAIGLGLIALLVLAYLAFSPNSIDVVVPTTETAVSTVTETPTSTPPPTPTPEPEPVSGAYELWPGFLEADYFRGEIGLGQTVSNQLRPGDADTWIFRDGPAIIDILVESSPAENNLIRLYSSNSLNWDDVIPPRGYVDDHALEPGRQYIASFEIPDAGDYVIAINDLNGNGSNYTLTVTESMPNPIKLGETVTGVLVGDNPGSWVYQGEPATVTIILQLDNARSGLLLVYDDTGRERAYVDIPDEPGELRASNLDLAAGATIVVRDTTNEGAGYTLTVTDTAVPPD